MEDIAGERRFSVRALLQSSIDTGWGPRGNFAAALLFLSGVFAYLLIMSAGTPMSWVVITAGIVGAYMALNIGANDVANNMAPAVGSGALSMGAALIIAAIFEAAGAIIAGGDVVATISKGIIPPEHFSDTRVFIWAMMASLFAAAVWVNLATIIGAPVSTTHSVVGGVAGAGIAASGFGAVDWGTMGKIAASWVISPVMGGAIAALFLYAVMVTTLFRKDKVAASRFWVPLFIAVMAGVFAMYLSIKGLKYLWKPSLDVVMGFGAFFFAVALVVSRWIILKQSEGLKNKKKSAKELFAVPLICGAALLSFAHGANDVANAVGPLAAIISAVTHAEITREAQIPLWVMVVGAMGIAAGLLIYGRRLIKIVGQEITRMDQTRAFCVALSAAITVLAASWLGLPVSSTHIAVGGIFGVGFLREHLVNRDKREAGTLKKKKNSKRRLVRRRHLISIAAAWIITVPAAGLIAAAIFIVVDLIYG